MPEPYDFRRAKWGMSKQEVRASEGSPPVIDDPDMIGFGAMFYGTVCMVYYNFEHERLVSGAYVIDQRDDADDVAMYLHLIEELKKKYGDPEREVDWRDPRRRFEFKTVAEVAKTVSTGEVELKAWWYTARTTILLICKEAKDAYNAFVALKYWDKDASDVIASAEDSRDFDLL